MSMNVAYLNALATFGSSIVTHLGLVNDQGHEISGSPYRRKAVSWAVDAIGMMRPRGDVTLDVAPGTVVAGWRGYSAATGGIDFGGEALPVERFNGQGQYTLIAGGTGVSHRVAT